ncbi:MAG: hypothetical protein ABIQ70_14565 [Dokdonella sp.]
MVLFSYSGGRHDDGREAYRYAAMDARADGTENLNFALGARADGRLRHTTQALAVPGEITTRPTRAPMSKGLGALKTGMKGHVTAPTQQKSE